MGLPPINPPLLNSANPWCSSQSDLEALHACPHTGAVTTRTSLLHGFPHDSSIHQHAFFSPTSHTATTAPDYSLSNTTDYPASLNTLGYSPFPLSTYLSWIEAIVSTAQPPRKTKPFIVSITGTPAEIVQCYTLIVALSLRLPQTPLAVEINLSCPNIAGKPPPAYSGAALKEYLDALAQTPRTIPLGIKTPPYTYAGQFDELVRALREAAELIDFVTATNTLGSCLVLGGDKPLLSSAAGTGIGGLAGEPLHALALGNVATLRRMLDSCPELANVDIIGVGGVGDKAAFDRMQAVGAKCVAVGTAYGREGLSVFGKILQDRTAKSRL